MKAVRTYEAYRAERAKNEEWANLVSRLMPPYRRNRRRDPLEAKLLRERGTPTSLIGPVK